MVLFLSCPVRGVYDMEPCARHYFVLGAWRSALTRLVFSSILSFTQNNIIQACSGENKFVVSLRVEARKLLKVHEVPEKQQPS